MIAVSSRRTFLQALLAGGAGLALPAVPAAQGTAVAVTSAFGGNVVVLNGADGVLLVNSGAATHAAELFAVLRDGSGGKPVQVLFNTDWHPDHTGGNELAAAGGARIVAHEHTKQYLGAELFVDWENRSYQPLPRKALPTETFYTNGALTFGGERIEYGHLGQAHTDGDIYVFFRDANVLAVGDVVTVGAYPIADYTTGGWLGGLATATKTLLDLTNDATRVIPGRGPALTRADLQAQYEMLSAMRDRLAKMMRQGLSAREMLESGVTREFDARWGDPALFLSTSYRGLWLHVRELGGIV